MTSINSVASGFPGFDELTSILNGRLSLIATLDGAMDKQIGNEPSLQSARETVLENERKLVESIIDDADKMKTFLKNIILVENLFNSVFEPHKAYQETARNKFAQSIEKYENGKKMLSSEAKSFINLIYAGQAHLFSLKLWIDKVLKKCEEDGVIIKSCSGAMCKKMERAFYKAFYVCNNGCNGSNDGFKQMTDILRCSFVFDDFEHLYKCFSVIESVAEGEGGEEGGILRVKDSFDPSKIALGYRNVLINMFCPGTKKIVCEIQLHWYPLYKYNKIADKMYQRARLWQISAENSEHCERSNSLNSNKAYDYAQKYLLQEIGSDTKYVPSQQEMHDTSDAVVSHSNDEEAKIGKISKLSEISNDKDDVAVEGERKTLKQSRKLSGMGFYSLGAMGGLGACW